MYSRTFVTTQNLQLDLSTLNLYYIRPMNKEQMPQIAQILYSVLMNGQFDSWHKREFEDYVAGEPDAPTYFQVIKELEFFISREIR